MSRAVQAAEEQPITSELVVAYWLCQRKAFLMLVGNQDGVSHEYTDLLDERASKRLSLFIETLQSMGFHLHASDEQRIIKSAGVIKYAKLKSGELEATVDALIRREPPNVQAKEDFLEAYITVGTNEVSRDAKIRLAFIIHVLSKTLRIRIEAGNFVNVSGKLSKIRVAKFFPEIEKIIGILASWKKSRPAPPPVIINPHCQVCEFRKSCLEQAEKDDNLSLLDRMTPKIMKKYQKKGIFTITQLSFLFRPRRPRKRRGPAPKKFSLELQALALRTEKIYVEEFPVIPCHDAEIFLDVEGIPDCGTHYLIGMVVAIGDDRTRYSFWADTEEEERKIFMNFQNAVEKHPNAPIYHYGNYERRCFEEISKKYHLNFDSVKSRFVNVNEFIFGKVYFPTRSNTLKDLGAFLGEAWTALEASGLMSVVWRLRWEASRDSLLKERLLTYNIEDCLALQRLVSDLRNMNQSAALARSDIDFAHNPKQHTTPVGQGIHDSLKGILRIAHSDYRKNHVEIRNGEVQGKPKRLPGGQKGQAGYYRVIPKPNKIVRVRRAVKCKNHEGKSGLLASSKTAERTVIDLVFTKNGCRKVVTKYLGTISYCPVCKERYRPPSLARLTGHLFGRGFRVWVVYQRVVLRLPYRVLAAVTKDIFHESLSEASILNFTEEISEEYLSAEKTSLQMILKSPFVHVDETKINIRGVNQYVWVLTDNRHVVLKLTETRESNFILEILKDYRGVLISDFYAGYDAAKCRQQKCLVHLIRDLNDDLWKNPYDAEFESFVGSFKSLLSPIIADIDKHGLKRHFLRKHEKAVEKFYQDVVEKECENDLVVGYQKRFSRYRESLFRFLEEDGIPWNNNAAERAIRQLAVQRKISGSFRRDTFCHYLRLLGIAQTCRFQGKSFLRFLLSGKKHVDQFKEAKRRTTSIAVPKRSSPTVNDT